MAYSGIMYYYEIINTGKIRARMNTRLGGKKP